MFNNGPTGTCGEQALTTHGDAGGCNQDNATAPLGTGAPMVYTPYLGINSTALDVGGKDPVCVSIGPNGNGTEPISLGAPQAPDELAYLAQPSAAQISACDQGTFANPKVIATNQTISPGSYCGGIVICQQNAKAQAPCPATPSAVTVTMKTGLYILNGHGMTVPNGATLTGTSGVTIFDTGSHSPYNVKNPTNDYWGDITLNTGATVNLTAQSTGTYAGILIFDARTLVNESSNGPCPGPGSPSLATWETCAKNTNYMQHSIGGANQNFQGTFYIPTTMMIYDAGKADHTTSKYSPFIGWILLWRDGGSLTINMDFSGLPGGNPLKKPVLGE